MSPLRFLRTLRYVSLRQAVARLRHSVWLVMRGKYGWSSANALAAHSLTSARLPVSREDQLRFGELSERWLNGRVEYIGINGGAADWQGAGKPKLWRYERHYHSELPALAARAQEDMQGPWLQAGHSLQDDWATETPPARGDAWEPYPTARRILNWAEAAAITPEIAASRMAPRLALQLKHLRAHLEHHLRGNHLICDAAALVAGGAMLAGVDGDIAMRVGARLLEKELKAQVLPDGGFDERSIQYHAIVLRDSLLALELSRTRPLELRPKIEATLSKMAKWLHCARRPDGTWPLVNDASPHAFAIAREALGRAVRLELFADQTEATPPAGSLVELRDTGWTFVRGMGTEVFFDTSAIGKHQQPGHSHDDALGYELRWYGMPVVTDSGTTTYETDPVRAFERSPAAHATISVDGKGIDEVWSAFRVGGRGKVVKTTLPGTDPRVYLLRGTARSHLGFEHERTLLFWPGRALLVFDHVTRNKRGSKVISHIPLDPSWSAAEAHGSIFMLGPGARGLQLHVLAGEFDGLAHGVESPREGFVGQGFGAAVPRTSVRIRADRDGLCVYSIVAPGVTARQTATGLALRIPGAEVAVRLREGKPY